MCAVSSSKERSAAQLEWLLGPHFVGSSTVACRWDITGPPPVRAARLMQYALANHLEVALDHSLYKHQTAPARMKLFEAEAQLKGSDSPIPV
jgi:hypothetical protein